MPTLSWVLEAAEDRYLEATDPVPAVVRRIVELACPFCARSFQGDDAREVTRSVARHIARQHPLKRPVLVVDGRVLGPNAMIARLPDPADVAIGNTTAIEASVDGGNSRAVSETEARQLLTDCPKRMLTLRLVNGRNEDGAAAAAEYRIKVDVADAHELDSVDQAFVRHLAREDPSRTDVMRFSDETDGLANCYRDGLASYVLGVFAKDDHDGSDPHVLERALNNLGRSAHHLSSFLDRGVGSAVAACARFNLNEIDPFEGATGISDVDTVSGFLLALSRNQDVPVWPMRPRPTESDVRCPVDEATFALLEFTLRLDGRSEDSLDEQLERLERASLTSPDRAKLAVVLGEWAHRNQRTDIVKRCARTLYNDAVFDGVATRWSAS